MICKACRNKDHANCLSHRCLDCSNSSTQNDHQIYVEKTWCDCQHLSNLVNFIGLELEQRERDNAKEADTEAQEGVPG